jgi:hypothetical protein
MRMPLGILLLTTLAALGAFFFRKPSFTPPSPTESLIYMDSEFPTGDASDALVVSEELGPGLRNELYGMGSEYFPRAQGRSSA